MQLFSAWVKFPLNETNCPAPFTQAPFTPKSTLNPRKPAVGFRKGLQVRGLLGRDFFLDPEWCLKLFFSDFFLNKKQKIPRSNCETSLVGIAHHPQSFFSFKIRSLLICNTCYMGVSKNMGIPKCMIYNGKPY